MTYLWPLVGALAPFAAWAGARLFVLRERKRDAINQLRRDLDAWGQS